MIQRDDEHEMLSICLEKHNFEKNLVPVHGCKPTVDGGSRGVRHVLQEVRASQLGLDGQRTTRLLGFAKVPHAQSIVLQCSNSSLVSRKHL